LGSEELLFIAEEDAEEEEEEESIGRDSFLSVVSLSW
jgi:hypothetical protein